jgi:glucose dehydrogenase
MLMAAVSNYVLGVGLDVWRLSPRQLAMGLGLVLMIPALLWLPVQAKWGKEN